MISPVYRQLSNFSPRRCAEGKVGGSGSLGNGQSGDLPVGGSAIWGKCESGKVQVGEP